MYIKIIGKESKTKWWMTIKSLDSFGIDVETLEDGKTTKNVMTGIAFGQPLNRDIIIRNELLDTIFTHLFNGNDMTWIIIDNEVVWVHEGLTNEDIGCNIFDKANELYELEMGVNDGDKA